MSDRGPRADASLPPDSDVLAKAKTLRALWESNHRVPMFDLMPAVDGLIEEVERLRAATLCEAERNPNPTDEEGTVTWQS